METVQDATIQMAVSRLGGIVEGNPTARHNFLQRIDELRKKESELDNLLCPVHASLDKRGDLKPFDNCIACIRNQRDELLSALADAAKSLETISSQAGRDEYLKCMDQVRGYANIRSIVARNALI